MNAPYSLTFIAQYSSVGGSKVKRYTSDQACKAYETAESIMEDDGPAKPAQEITLSQLDDLLDVKRNPGIGDHIRQARNEKSSAKVV